MAKKQEETDVAEKPKGEMPPYPINHPRGEEIRALRTEANDAYAAMEKSVAQAREHYKTSMEELKQMGVCNGLAQDNMQACASALKKLLAILEEPTI